MPVLRGIGAKQALGPVLRRIYEKLRIERPTGRMPVLRGIGGGTGETPVLRGIYEKLRIEKGMSIIICPGFHGPELTEGFLEGLFENWRDLEESGDLFIFPAEDSAPYSAIDILNFLCCAKQPIAESGTETGLLFISFSAGAVGAIGAAWGWRQMGRRVKAFIAVDGWGMPLGGDFPIYRISHDRFTHWSSALLGGGQESFYADPAVEHLDLWRSPQTARGWWLNENVGAKTASPATAAEFVNQILKKHIDN
ncbi:MAG: hypothetical protein SXA11_22665 [Cyanobacteriota bacterium]|nr:hypothetical protein [Cyanobacteriota bacterium]